MKTLNFRKYKKGVLANLEDDVAKEMLDQVVQALLEHGVVRLIDPHEAIHSRVKYPFWNVKFRVTEWLFNHLGVDWYDKDHSRRDAILNWMDENRIYGWYDLDAYDTLPKGHLQFVHPSAEKIKALWAETGPKV